LIELTAEPHERIAIDEHAGRECAMHARPGHELAQQRVRIQHVAPAPGDAQIGGIE